MAFATQDHPLAARRIVPILLSVVPFSQIPLDAYTPGLPQMVAELGADPAALQNTVTAYMLGMSLGLCAVAGILLTRALPAVSSPSSQESPAP